MTKAPDTHGKIELNTRSKRALIQIIVEQRQMFYRQLEEKENRIVELTQRLAQQHQAQEAEKEKTLNLKVNQPSSKKPEWDKDGNPL